MRVFYVIITDNTWVVFTIMYTLHPSRLSSINDYKTLMFGKITFIPYFTEVYKNNKQYKNLTHYHNKIIPTTNFGYGLWLYCLSGRKKELFKYTICY